MPFSHQFLKILGLSSVVFLTACGGDSDSDSDSSTDSGSSSGSNNSSLAGTTSFSESLVLGKRFFITSPQSNGVTDISTAVFASSGNTVNWGEGYIDSADGSDYFLEEYSWSVDSGKMSVDGTGSIKSSSDDYLVVCFYEDDNSSDCDGDDNNERWYVDKDKANAYVTSSSTGGTSVNLNLITDSVLKAQFTALEFDYIEQVEEINRQDAGITSVAGLQQFTELEKLTLYENQISDISDLSALINLRWLLISDQVDSNGDDLNLESYDAIDSMTKLIKLELSEYDSDNRPEKFDLAAFINDTSADKTNLEFLFFWGLPLTNTDVAAIDGLTSLRKLSISEGVVTDFDQWNTTWNNVTELRVSGNTAKATLSLAELVSGGIVWSNIEKLELSNTDIDGTDLVTILDGVSGSDGSLRFLDIQNTNITSYDAFDNYSLPKLERIKLKYGAGSSNRATYDLGGDLPFTKSKMTRLEIENGDISNFDVASYTSLERLDIRDSNITDTTVADFKAALAGLSSLSRVDIGNAQIAGASFTCNDIGVGTSTTATSCRQ
ncbi:hypothetical protein ACFQ45_08500 [Rhodanobacter aciditrophus]|uniref:Leucine-rich repeat domain-containing protein n=1 Tax=Rhodanobacter aciditrophus TaxID=1623218 RepID=A0ABW4AZK1_9GAMM